MFIKGFLPTSLIDFPGKISSVVFTFGCNFSCFYCHNPELVLKSDMPFISEEEILKKIEEGKKFKDGVVITGGEPTIQKDLKDFIKKIKGLNLLVKLDTNGSNPEILKNLIDENLIDYIAMDIKAPLEKYSEIAGKSVDIENIKKSVETVRNFKDYEFRTTVPKALSREDIIKIGEWLKGSEKYFLQQVQTKKTLESVSEIYSREELEGFAKILQPFFKICRLR